MLTSQEARAIVAKWRDKFPSAEALMTSYDRYEARIAGPARNATGFERWLAEDADQQHVRAAVMSTLILTAESQPQQGVDLDPPTLAHFVANGDLHDWSELEPVRHAAKCPRCQ